MSGENTFLAILLGGRDFSGSQVLAKIAEQCQYIDPCGS